MRALQALYMLEIGPPSTPEDALASSWQAADEDGPPDPVANAFALKLVRGVRERLAELDALLDATSQHWRVARMQRVDRNVLRLGAFELLHLPDIPRKVSINEAVELGKEFGTEDSSAFINGLLDRIAASTSKQ